MNDHYTPSKNQTYHKITKHSESRSTLSVAFSHYMLNLSSIILLNGWLLLFLRATSIGFQEQEFEEVPMAANLAFS